MNLNGILNVNKPKGITAHDAVAKVRRLAGTKRVGHAGTLDPAATGVLPICIGAATRVAEYLSDAGKAYRASIALGLATASYDLETPPTMAAEAGELSHLAALTIPELEAVLQTFVGPQLQIPPMYSALHMGGQRLYDLARAGQEVERTARPITIYSLKLLSFAPLLIGEAAYPTLKVEVECSKGTYIRSLAVDIGVKLGAPAVLAALVRIRSGPFRLEDAHSLDQLAEAAQAGRLAELLYPTDYALADLSRVDLSADDVLHIRMGQTIPADEPIAAEGTLARAYSTDGNFIAILRLQARRWQPSKVFNLDLELIRPRANNGSPLRTTIGFADTLLFFGGSCLEIYTDLAQLQGHEVALTIGTFDGVHRGHQHLIGRAVESARQHGWRSAVMTFEPHPRFMFWPDSPPVLLCTDAEKRKLIARSGADILIALPFTRELATNSTRQFAQLLTRHLTVRELWEGPDFTMGNDLLSVDYIAQLGAEMGFAVNTIERYSVDGTRVSSSAIRQAITEGRMQQAATMLGRYYSIQGAVVHGAQRGRQLGYPTANLDPPPHLAMPGNGIYATFAYLYNSPRAAAGKAGVAEQTALPSATNVGYRPMFADGSRNVETYIFDFDADIYDRDLRVAFVAHQRGEEKFASLEALITQMAADCQTARATLERAQVKAADLLAQTFI